LPVKSKERKIRINDISAEARTVILHEAPHKLRTTLDDLGAALGADRKISLCRELTKLNEEIMRTTIGEAIEYYAEREPRGEYVLVLEGRSNSDDAAPDMTPEEAVAFYEDQGMDKKDAIKSAAKLLGVPKNEIYNRIMKK
jgi:16S rRNA (cytidine1402-2'-O)-methyltransferase